MEDKVYSGKDHIWVICAYKESRYLEECIQSLLNQTVKSRIRIVTSTPCEHISNLAAQYGLDVSVNHGKTGISGDWNFALDQGETELITIAHQDDTYEPEYTEKMLERMNKSREPILYFTNYGELREGEKVQRNKLLKIKRTLMIPTRLFPGRKTARRLSFLGDITTR